MIAEAGLTKSGFFYHFKDKNELARAIITLAESRDLRQRLGLRAREVAIQNHTWTRNAERVLQAYDSLNDEQSR